MAMNKADFDKLGCGCCGKQQPSHGAKQPMYLHARCHSDSYLEAYYQDGLVVICCARCKKKAVSIEVQKELVH